MLREILIKRIYEIRDGTSPCPTGVFAPANLKEIRGKARRHAEDDIKVGRLLPYDGYENMSDQDLSIAFELIINRSYRQR